MATRDPQPVTRRDINSLLSQVPPRYVPPNIRGQRLGPTSALFAFLGPLIAVCGLAYAVAGGALAGGQWNGQRISFLIVGAAFALAGGLSGFFAWRYRHRNMRILRRGALASGAIESIEETDFYVGQVQQYRSHFRLVAEGREWTAECFLDKGIAKLASKYAETNSPARVLYDPDHPERILWMESLITVGEKSEPSGGEANSAIENSASDDFRR